MNNSTAAPAPNAKIELPAIPILCVNVRQAAIMTTDGEIRILNHKSAQKLIHQQPVMLCHAPYTAKTMGIDHFSAPSFDILELFAFVHPGRFCVPTPTGIAKALGISPPEDFESTPFTLMEAATALLSDLSQDPYQAKANPLKIAHTMGMQGRVEVGGWPWTPFVFSALGETYDPRIPVNSKSDLNIWKHLPEWSEEAPPPPPSHHPVTKEEAETRLKQLLGDNAEARTQQIDYTKTLTHAFDPKKHEDDPPHVVLAEAGTGVGKTLGYLAPASVWAEKNKGSVWVSTYTKNLQRQVNQELDRLYPDADLKAAKISVRKGRENYLCLLNFEDAAVSTTLSRIPRQAVAVGIMARWIAATNDGDLISGIRLPRMVIRIIGISIHIRISGPPR